MAVQQPIALAWLLCLAPTACASNATPAVSPPAERQAPETGSDQDARKEQDDDLDELEGPAQVSGVIRFDDETSSDGPETALRAPPRRKAIPSMELFGTGPRDEGPVMTIPDDED